VGVFSIIGVMTAMGVLLNSIQSGMSALGATTFQIQKYPMFENGDPAEWAKLRNRKKISFEQALRVKESATLAQAVGIFAFMEGREITRPSGEKTNPNVALSGRDIEGFTANSWSIGEGRLFSQGELSAAKHVIVVGEDIVKKLFPKEYPIGQTVRVDGREFEVIGTVATRGNTLGGNGSYFAVIPLTTFFNIYGKDRELSIKVQAANPEGMDDCIEQARQLLRIARRVQPGADDDFYIWSNDSVITQFNDFTKYVRLGIMIISAIALLAAGVGIMNIMLVSVTERTREIGIRKAVGAKRSNILSQFVLEAILISQFGGLLGILLGIVGGNMLAVFMGVDPMIPYDWVAIGFLTCNLIGMVFGVYPAWKASNLDPIESLRYE
jgi:putative ABC transport system permease protein